MLVVLHTSTRWDWVHYCEGASNPDLKSCFSATKLNWEKSTPSLSSRLWPSQHYYIKQYWPVWLKLSALTAYSGVQFILYSYFQDIFNFHLLGSSHQTEGFLSGIQSHVTLTDKIIFSQHKTRQQWINKETSQQKQAPKTQDLPHISLENILNKPSYYSWSTHNTRVYITTWN